jgi:ectoine hydroxylase-related dioxygenase (phytanoyl-CoA dioxygenase family)
MSVVRQHHIDQYQAEGCVRVENAFARDWIEKLTEGALRMRAEMRVHGFPKDDPPRSRVQNAPDMDDHDGFTNMRNCAPFVPEFMEWVWHSPAGEIVGELMQAEHVRFWLDATFVKEGNKGETATPYHTDESTFPFWGQMLPSLWIALTDVEIDNSPLTTLAGSNKDPHRYYSTFSPQGLEMPSNYRPWKELIERATAPNADIRVWTAKAGDCLLVHPRTIHGSLPRTSSDPNGRRVAFTSRWIGSDVYWDPDPLAFRIKKIAGDPRLVPGAKPPDDLFPIVWKRGEGLQKRAA